jgi:hypothetical protein
LDAIGLQNQAVIFEIDRFFGFSKKQTNPKTHHNSETENGKTSYSSYVTAIS